MKHGKALGISEAIFKEYVKEYFLKSLISYPDNYLNLIFSHIIEVQKHLAYLCPLCVKNCIYYDDQVKLVTTTPFSLDHYPAKNSGGGKTMLVCKSCNSEAGHDYDHALKKHVSFLSFSNRIPNSKIASTTSIKDVSGFYRGYLKIDNDGTTEVSFKSEANFKVPVLDDLLMELKRDVNLTFKTPDETKVQKALLHAAYLYCFEYFGYQFVFSPAGDLIRDILNGTNEYPVSVLDINVDNEVAVNQLPTGLCFISKPTELQSLVVNIKLVEKDTKYTCIKTVLIQNPTDTGIEDLKHTANLLKAHLGNVDIVPLKNLRALENANPYFEMWALLQREYKTIRG